MQLHLWSRSETREWTIVLFIGSVAVYAARVALPICVVAVAREFGWSKTESGAVMACFFWGYASTQLFGGWLADRVGGDEVLQRSTAVWSVLTLLTPVVFTAAYTTSSPLAVLTVLRVAMGTSQGFHFPSMASLTSQRLTASEKGRVFGIVTAGSHVGTVICGSAGSLLLDNYGWRFVFYFIGLLSLCWCAVLYKLSTKRRRHVSPKRRKQQTTLLLPPQLSNSGEGVTESAFDVEDPSRKEVRAVPWGLLLRQPPFIAAVIAHYCGANAFYTLFSWLPSYFSEVYPDEARGWVFNVVPYASVAVTSMLSPYMCTVMLRRGFSVTFVRRFMECGSLMGIAVCLFAVSFVKSYTSAIALLTMAMAARGLHHGGVSVNPQDIAPNHTGAVFGLINMAGAIPGFVGVYVAGYLLQQWHSWPHVFAATGAQCVIGAIVFGLLGTGKQLI